MTCPQASVDGTPSPEQISRSRKLLENQYAYLDGDGQFSATSILPEAQQTKLPALPAHRIAQILAAHRIKKGRPIPGKAIEALVRDVHKELWLRRVDLWSDGGALRALDILNPGIVLQFIGYRFDASEVLGQYSRGGEVFEVAGIIDRSTKFVRVSPQFAPEIQNFTAAHELGHAILHQGAALHRDRGLDGSAAQGLRDHVEIEADRFATHFLMPERLVRERFEEMFCAAQFVLTEDTAFALDPSLALNRKAAALASRRDLARTLAGAERYNGKHMRSLAGQFRVSVEAMAIRLEELDLLLI